MGFINGIMDFIRKNIKIILISIQLAKELEERLDPNEKFTIDDKVLDILDKLAKKVQSK